MMSNSEEKWNHSYRNLARATGHGRGVFLYVILFSYFLYYIILTRVHFIGSSVYAQPQERESTIYLSIMYPVSIQVSGAGPKKESPYASPVSQATHAHMGRRTRTIYPSGHAITDAHLGLPRLDRHAWLPGLHALD
jgi:hypothetical protein